MAALSAPCLSPYKFITIATEIQQAKCFFSISRSKLTNDIMSVSQTIYDCKQQTKQNQSQNFSNVKFNTLCCSKFNSKCVLQEMSASVYCYSQYYTSF